MSVIKNKNKISQVSKLLSKTDSVGLHMASSKFKNVERARNQKMRAARNALGKCNDVFLDHCPGNGNEDNILSAGVGVYDHNSSAVDTR